MKSCMVVDDSRVVRKVARRILETFGFECEEAEDGEKAFAACSAAMPDLILLDWNMPVMSGLEFLEKVRRLKNGNHPNIILCTTENDTRHIQRAMKAGANEYIMKPFDSDIMRTKLSQIGAL
jgi:two-component system chemotaxis response regulator CheY